MIFLGRKNRRGITVADFFLVILIIFFGISALSNVLTYRKVKYRDQCYENQKQADELLWKIVYEQKKEIPQLSSAYILSEPDGTQKMYLIFMGSGRNALPEKFVVDLKERGYDGIGLCPLRGKKAPKQPIVDYWYGAGRWWCMHNTYHN